MDEKSLIPGDFQDSSRRRRAERTFCQYRYPETHKNRPLNREHAYQDEEMVGFLVLEWDSQEQGFFFVALLLCRHRVHV